MKADFATVDLGLKVDVCRLVCSGKLCEDCRRLELYRDELCVGGLVCNGESCNVSGLTPSEGRSVSLCIFILD